MSTTLTGAMVHLAPPSADVLSRSYYLLRRRAGTQARTGVAGWLAIDLRRVAYGRGREAVGGLVWWLAGARPCRRVRWAGAARPAGWVTRRRAPWRRREARPAVAGRLPGRVASDAEERSSRAHAALLFPPIK